MKIQKIEITNLKAVEKAEVDLKGCSVMITGGNNEGKSTIAKSLVDRFRGNKPELIVKEGEKNGNYTMELTDGSIIEWKFTNKTERFSFTTKEGVKQTLCLCRFWCYDQRKH